MRIAIIGTGISGLGAAYLLAPAHDITVYEAAARPGGHARTIDVPGVGPVDTGFIVCNDRTYPNLLGLFDRLGVARTRADMAFGVSLGGGALEYSSSAPFAQPGTLARPSHWAMLRDILRFNRAAPRWRNAAPEVTLGDMLAALRLSTAFTRRYLLPMAAAIWSTPVARIADFPAAAFVRFFEGHGLLTLLRQPQWYSVAGGSRTYVERIAGPLGARLRLSCAVTRLEPSGPGWAVHDARASADVYDAVVLACHPDQALALIAAPTEAEARVLGAFTYQDNALVVHSDAALMPRRRAAWASWVYLSDDLDADTRPRVSLTYWMNALQNLPDGQEVFVTLNPARPPRADLTYDRHTFRHPRFDAPALRAQGEVGAIQGARGLWFCGAWQRHGFHEDGLWSAVRVARALGARVPWG
jgi:uncharacterized protein